MLFGFDTIGRALEIGCERLPNRKWKIIHAMKLRKGYEKYLEGGLLSKNSQKQAKLASIDKNRQKTSR